MVAVPFSFAWKWIVAFARAPFGWSETDSR